MYKNKDGCITLFAIEENLSSDGTIRMTADYAASIRNKQLAEHDYDDDIEHPIAEDIAVIMCDGAPCGQYMSLLAEDRNEEDCSKKREQVSILRMQPRNVSKLAYYELCLKRLSEALIAVYL